MFIVDISLLFIAYYCEEWHLIKLTRSILPQLAVSGDEQAYQRPSSNLGSNIDNQIRPRERIVKNNISSIAPLHSEHGWNFCFDP